MFVILCHREFQALGTTLEAAREVCRLAYPNATLKFDDDGQVYSDGNYLLTIKKVQPYGPVNLSLRQQDEINDLKQCLAVIAVCTLN